MSRLYVPFRSFNLYTLDMEIPLVQTKGGHFLVPVKIVAGVDGNNIIGDEADAVMMLVLQSTTDEDKKEISSQKRSLME